MRRRIAVVEADLRAKHRAMAKVPFAFLRATFYRWVALWREACPELAEAPRLLAIGDLHAENFGTWRDAEGRLCWGINDFDEAFPMPYAIDLVRLATSLMLAIRTEGLKLTAGEACSALLAGYAAGLEQGRGFVLEEEHPALRAMAMGAERDPDRFWAKLAQGKPATPPHGLGKLLRKALPEAAEKPRILHRTAGLGSLGRPRYVAIGMSGGGLVAREAKAVLPSAYAFALGRDDEKSFTGAVAKRAIRSPDPFYRLHKRWLLRRLAPHCAKIEFTELPRWRDDRHLVKAMGRETANVHLGTPEAAAAIRRDLKRRKSGWLFDAASRMATATLADWQDWRRRHG